MMRLAPSMGRERAHDLVYRAASEARQKERVTTEEEKLQKQDARGHGK
jgi:adenylosuccinate lyase